MEATFAITHQTVLQVSTMLSVSGLNLLSQVGFHKANNQNNTQRHQVVFDRE